MRKGETKEKTVEKVTSYISNRLQGDNKQKAMQKAGYSESTSRVPLLVERTKVYQAIVDEILTENATTMRIIASNLREQAESGKLEQLKATEQGQLYKVISDINNNLIPKVTLKESTDKNGNVTRTAWAQNASQVQEVMEDKE